MGGFFESVIWPKLFQTQVCYVGTGPVSHAKPLGARVRPAGHLVLSARVRRPASACWRSTNTLVRVWHGVSARATVLPPERFPPCPTT